MPHVMKRRRVVNPGRPKRRMSLLQKLHFGTKRQRAAARASKSTRNPRHKKSVFSVFKKGGVSKSSGRPIGSYITRPKRRTRAKRLGNIGEIVTVLPGFNPGTKRSKRKSKLTNKGANVMARHRKTRRAKAVGTRVHRRRRARNPVYKRRIRRGQYLYATNPRRRRRANPGRRRYAVAHRRRAHRRNPGMLGGGGTVGKVLGILGGAMVTKVATDMLPTSLGQGYLGYLSTAVVAMLQGKLIGKVTRNASLGQNMTIGGFTYLALKLVSDFMPSLSLPFGLKGGMGILTPSSFYVPQVNMPGSMASFVTPAGIPVSSGMKGINSRRVGRTA